MKVLLVLLLFVFEIACDTGKYLTTKEKTIDDTTEMYKKTDTNVPKKEYQTPGTITFMAKVLEIYQTNTMICGVSRPNVLQVEVLEILTEGSGISHMPHSKDILLVSLLFPSKDLKANSILLAKAKESLCSDISKNYFTINSFEILD